ncbi:hypothetical protein J4210_01450 [Candidatus Woesearchaeota archaeon]|nr:hypothetical protein [Candidatus Woesearchaeota archaeon]
MTKATDKKQVSRVKTKKKSWFRVIAPPFFGQLQIGETYVENPETILGRKIDVNLKELTNNIKDQSAYVSFRMISAEGAQVHTEPMGFYLTPSHVKRLVRKSTSRLDDYFVFSTKAGERVIIKTIMVTRSKIQRSVRTALSSTLRSLLQEEFQKTDFNGFLSLLIGGRLRKTLFALNKISPLREAAVRVASLQVKKDGQRITAETSSALAAEEMPAADENTEDQAEDAFVEEPEEAAEEEAAEVEAIVESADGEQSNDEEGTA